MDVDDFYLVVVLKVLAQFCDIDVHGASVEIVVINPDGLKGEVALQDVVGMAAEEREQLVFFCCELGLLIANGEKLLLGVEHEAAEPVYRAFLVFLSSHSSEYGFNTEYEFFH